MLNTVEATHGNGGIFTPAGAARFAVAVEQAARQALATLDAIEAAGFLEGLPADSNRREGHSTALTLLTFAQQALASALSDDAGSTALMLVNGGLMTMEGSN